MKEFRDRITINKNKRGCYILDPVKGCPFNCYGECYSRKIATRYGFDFSVITSRNFNGNPGQVTLFNNHSNYQTNNIYRFIRRNSVPFIRMGETGDPSLDWNHTLQICSILNNVGVPIVVVTKHIKEIPKLLLPQLEGLYINTSISALDSDNEINYRMYQYNRLKKYCNSLLRVVSCDFNKNLEKGYNMAKKQRFLLGQTKVIDTIFRPSRGNALVIKDIIKTEKAKFLSSSVLVSRHRKDIYFGNCTECSDQCGVNLCN